MQQAWRKSLPHSVPVAYDLFVNICAFNDWMFCHKSGTKLHWLARDVILESLDIFSWYFAPLSENKRG